MPTLFQSIIQRIEAFRDRPSLEARIKLQVDQLYDKYCTTAHRVCNLERHEASVSEFHMTTIAKALKEHYDVKQLLQQGQIDNLHRQLDAGCSKHDATIADLHTRIEEAIVEIAKTNSRITSILTNLRQVGGAE